MHGDLPKLAPSQNISIKQLEGPNLSAESRQSWHEQNVDIQRPCRVDIQMREVLALPSREVQFQRVHTRSQPYKFKATRGVRDCVRDWLRSIYARELNLYSGHHFVLWVVNQPHQSSSLRLRECAEGQHRHRKRYNRNPADNFAEAMEASKCCTHDRASCSYLLPLVVSSPSVISPLLSSYCLNTT